MSPVSIVFFLNQNDVVLLKKQTKINGLQPGLAGSTRSLGQPVGSAGLHRVFSFLIFFKPGLVPTPELWSTHLAGLNFKNMPSNFDSLIMCK